MNHSPTPGPDPSGAPTAAGGPASTPPPPGAAPTPHAMDGFWSWCRSLGVTRSSDRWIGGVAGGLAQRFGVDPLLVRGILVASVVLGGIGILAYAAAWALLPEPDGRIHAEQLLRGNFDQAVAGIGLLLLIGLGPASWLGWGDWGPGRVLRPVSTGLVVTVLVIWLATRKSGPKRPPSPSPSAAGAPAQPVPGSGPMAPTAPAGSAPWGSPDLTPLPAPLLHDAGSATSAPPSSFSNAARQAQEKASAKVAEASRKAAQKAAEKAAARRTGPGAATVATVVALVVLALAGLALGDRVGWWEASQSAAIGISLGLLGLGIVICGLRGRRGGVLSSLAVVGIVLAPFAATGTAWSWNSDQTTIVGEAQWAPTTVSEAERGVRVGAGNTEVDLTGLTLSGIVTDPDAEAANPVVIPITLGAGEAVVTVPDGVAIAADITVGLGSAEWDTETSFGKISGPASNQLVLVGGPEAATTDDAQIVLDVTVGLGSLTIAGETP